VLAKNIAFASKALSTESLECLRGFKAAIDADLLLKKVTNYAPRQSIQEANLSIDHLL
jgi:hypothetical protein